MKIPTILGAVTVASALWLGAAAAFGHHAFSAEFDVNKCKEFTGTLTKVDWQSPHPYFYVDIKDSAGKVENWSFQTYAPITLRRNGTERQLFVEGVGKEVWVRGCLAKNGRANYAAAGTMKFPDGVLRQVGQIQE